MTEPNKAIFKKGQLTRGIAYLALQANGTRTPVKLAVHDGDTINVDPRGNLGVRFLGVDAPETTAQLLGEEAAGGQPVFRSVDSQQWKDFLSDPFAASTPPFKPQLPAGLRAHLVSSTGPRCAENHRKHALKAANKLEEFVQADVDSEPNGKDGFQFFLAFAHEVIDRYGRFLAYIHHYTPQALVKPKSYNEQLLIKGLVSPYFIWPNIDPFLDVTPESLEVPKPGKAISAPSLDDARKAFKAARQQQIGLFENNDPLQLEPFELRYLARVDANGTRHGPDRWVIDLSKTGSRLHKPTDYYKIKNSEDRLFVPSEYVPLFIDKGWKK